MDPRLIQFYTQELTHVRDMGAEFAERFPKIASRLAMDSTEVKDPYVERLLEGFAFLTARVQLRLHEEFPRFTEQLLNRISPNFLAPVPSMGVVQLNPNLTEVSLKKGVEVPAGTLLQSHVAKGMHTSCKFRLGHAITLWPLQIERIEHGPFKGSGTRSRGGVQTRSALHCVLNTAGLGALSQLPLDSLDFHISCGEEYAFSLFDRICHQAVEVLARPAGQTQWTKLSTTPQPLGLDENQALLPVDSRQFSGARLLQEFFGFPQRFLFFRLAGLRDVVSRCEQSNLELAICFSDTQPEMDRIVGADSLALNCAPVVNLFEHNCDRVVLDARQHEVHVMPNRVHPLDYEVHTVLAVEGHGQQLVQPIPALYAPARSEGAADLPHYMARRTPTHMPDKRVREGGRSAYLGSEVYLGLTQPNGELITRHGLQQLAVRALCSNRDLPLLMPIGQQGATDLQWPGNLPLLSVRFLRGPSRPKMPVRMGQSAWHLIEHLSSNYLGLVDSGGNQQGAQSITQLLNLFADPTLPSHKLLVQAIQSVDAQPIVQRILRQGRPAVVKGLEVTLTIDELALQGLGLGVFANVLAHYFAAHVSVNAFVRTRVRGVQSGAEISLPAMTGSRPLV